MTRLAVLCGVVGLLAGCSSIEDRQKANGGFDYLEEATSKKLLLPEGVDSPDFNDDYAVEPLSNEADEALFGESLNILSPSLVLPLVTGSHIEEGKQEATVWFDKVDDSQALDTTIWNSLINYLEEQGIAVDSFDKNANTLLTDWMIIETEESNSWYSWTSTERKIGKRFEFSVELAPHGRTAALKTKLVDYVETINDQIKDDANVDQIRRSEVDALNQVISHYQHQIRVADVKRYRKLKEGLPMKMGFDSDGEPAFVVGADYEDTWPRLLLVLRKLGFNVKDLDKSTGLLFVNYGGAESSWWSNLFSSEDDGINLDTTDYRVKVAAVGEKTSVTLMNDESEPFDAKAVTDLFDAFATTMSSDDLDI